MNPDVYIHLSSDGKYLYCGKDKLAVQHNNGDFEFLASDCKDGEMLFTALRQFYIYDVNVIVFPNGNTIKQLDSNSYLITTWTPIDLHGSKMQCHQEIVNNEYLYCN
jgi:hypothetical protein